MKPWFFTMEDVDFTIGSLGFVVGVQSAGPAGLGAANVGRWHQLSAAAKLRGTDDAAGDEIGWIAGAVDGKK